MKTQLLMNTELSHAEAQASLERKHKKGSSPWNRTRSPKSVHILAVCMALQMTSYVLIQPLFARRFSQLGAGVETLGESSMAFALAATLMAPVMGILADRIGRRAIVLFSLAVYALAFSGYMLAASAPVFILLRGLAGALTAGLMPAMIGIVADLAPASRRAQWIGIVTGGASVGWIAGPILGGVLYDRWGYTAALAVSVCMALATFILALFAVQETKGPALNPRPEPGGKKTGIRPGMRRSYFSSLRNSFPKPLSAFLLCLWIVFVVMFAWAFIEPRAQFYAYDELGWSSTKLGLVMSTYGISMTLGELGLSQLSDRLGRRPVILLGLALFSVQFIGLAVSRNYILITAAFLVAGLGNALYDPALTAAILDIGSSKHKAGLLGIKSTAASLGNIIGPGLVVLFTPWLSPHGIFLISASIVLLTLLAMLAGQLVKRLSRTDAAENALVKPRSEPPSVNQGEMEP